MAADQPAIEGQAQELPADGEGKPNEDFHPPDTGTDVAVVPAASREVIRPLDAGQVVEAMTAHQELLRRILDPTDWQGPPDKQGSFVKKSGWRKVALAYNLNMARVHEEVERDDDGMPLRASYTARATATNGRSVEATGHCAFAEKRFSGEKGNRTKLENDMRATAETRAKNRAISDLIGMGKVSAEEAEAAPPFGDAASDDTNTKFSAALMALLDNDEAAAAAAYTSVKTDAAGGYLPEVAAQAVLIVARAVVAQRNTTKEDTNGGK